MCLKQSFNQSNLKGLLDLMPYNKYWLQKSTVDGTSCGQRGGDVRPDGKRSEFEQYVIRHVISDI